jgi:hypothetical protein
LVAVDQVEGDECRGLAIGQVVKAADDFSGRLEEHVAGTELGRGVAVALERDHAALHVPGDGAGMKVRACRLARRELHPVRFQPVRSGVHRLSQQLRSADIRHVASPFLELPASSASMPSTACV